jgi:hypothetical protein
MAEVYKGTTLLGTRDASGWSFINQTGYIGLRVNNGPAFLLDDFGGGTVAGGVGPEEPTTADGRLQTALVDPARLQADAESLTARHAAWQAEYQRLLGLEPARPSGCKPLCDLLAASLGHTPVSPQPGERV